MPKTSYETDREFTALQEELATNGSGRTGRVRDTRDGVGPSPTPREEFGKDANHWAECEGGEGHDYWQGPGPRTLAQAEQDAANHNSQWRHRPGEGASII
ncbi:hypothetical protein ACFROC_11610 [Nocardia tengchongensis]|uniref:hypothetical protein n=1 Tax=Nocardia tengchongensis TaxID=2055889 RepID=UPI0036C9AB11